MADRRFSPHPIYGGGRGIPMGMQPAGPGSVPGYHPYNQQVMMMPNMRFPMQSVRMGPPNMPPPPYSAHIPNPGVANRPRITLDKSKGNQLSDKEKAFQEQRQKLRMFGKPGMTKVDPEALIGSMFAKDTTKKTSESKMANSTNKAQEEDDGFGDFLQGPSVPSDSKPVEEEQTIAAGFAEPMPEPSPKPAQVAEKKDLESMMMEFSDLNAPKKARGFHKPTLNEVQKHGHQHAHKSRVPAFHDSDHARSWRQQCDDLSGLFQLPERAPQPPPVHRPTVATAGFAGSEYAAVTNVPGAPSVPVAAASVQGEPTHGQQPHAPPQWYFCGEEQLPPVYKHVWEASLVNDQISTERLYPILLMSGLPREKLAQIWSVCNTSTPGQLAKQELWAVLALIALTQKNFDTSSLDILAMCPEPPVPLFAAAQAAHPTAAEPGEVNPMRAAQEEEFADFQAAAAPVQRQTPYKEPPNLHTLVTAVSAHHPHYCQEQPGTTGSSRIHSQAHQQQQQNRQQQHQPLEHQQVENKLEGLDQCGLQAVDDKYGNNVRSFFCSSGSSTGHTSPSFEEDYYTDGRDSLSQLSTSEQSENEDIRNLENYVEELNNQKTQAPASSPLHCPFPAVQQPHTVTNTSGGGQTLPSVPFNGNTLLSPATLESASQRNNNNLALSTGKGAFPSGAGVTSVSDNFAKTSGLAASNPHVFPRLDTSSAEGDGEFSEFKSAPSGMSSISSTVSSDPKEVSLIKDEDKYDALRAFSAQAEERAQPLGFDQALRSEPAGPQDAGEASQADGEEDWADFAAAPEPQQAWAADEQDMQKPPPPALTSKEQILTLFNKPSDTGSPAGSLFRTTTGSSNTDSSAAASAGDMADSSDSSKLDQQLNAGNTNTFEASFFEQAHPSSSVHTVRKPQEIGLASMFAGVPVSSSSSSPSLSDSVAVPGIGSTTESSVFSASAVESVAEDWGKYSTGSVSLSNPLEAVKFSGSTEEAGDEWGDFAATTAAAAGVANPAEENWCDFDSAVDDADASQQEANGGNKFVTIKKQNLGTNEILGLFKVRDDPTTLSSYQLPQPAAGKPRTKPQPSVDDDDGFGPPPMDFSHDDDEDDLTFSRGYDLDDVMQRQVPATTYSLYGHTISSPVYSQAKTTRRAKESKEESGSVNSLELRPSSQPGDYSGSDSHSVSSADMSSGTGNVADGQSKSTDSLDRKSDVLETDGDPVIGEEPNQSQAQQTKHHPIKAQELLASMPDFGDKYNIEQEAQGSDHYGHEWMRCLFNCCEVITQANTLFNTISSSAVCNEVLKSNQGSQYIASVVEIYRVVCRVMTSMRSTAISTTELEQTLKTIDLAWNNLTAFLVGVSLLPDPSTLVFDNCVLKSDSEHSKGLACGICLLNVDTSPAKTLIQSASSGCSKLTYAGRQYHSTCANFWVNCVDQTLPALTLPELL